MYLSTSNTGWLRTTSYNLTQPCLIGDCPHDRDPATCDAADGREYASKCPSVRPPHDIRRGSISDHLRRGWPIQELAERVNATPKVIRKHYDVRRARESMLTRSELLAETTKSTNTMSPPPQPPVDGSTDEDSTANIDDGDDRDFFSDGPVRI
ncbi:hypothetical protein [Halarchaeum rubridurum]|uniref:Uncharacterized protein n=1 Tax=Halarchaeum rubridurum TaxID=489911 RepID=A0A830FY05_9EURY|nr:hypothetical protein [Halarchaeum rubridurum]GGM56647.1 hypothetical protein GCM10009017_03480 [Halarchaeum rubridurum]